MYILDRDPERRWRPWHIYAGGDPYVVFALCSKVFDVRPEGVDFGGGIERDLVCGICLAKQAAEVPTP